MEQYKHILFIDIETVSVVPDFDKMGEGLQNEWIKKSRFLKNSSTEDADAATLFKDKAGIFSEFAKVVCIGFGSLYKQDDGWKLRLKALTGHDEKELLKDFCELLSRFTSHYPGLAFCGHNIKEFDIPFLCRRMIINNLGLPDCMQLSGKKPWEISHVDTMDLWRFGDYKNFTPLSLLAEVLGIPTPKDDIDGSRVGQVYWDEQDLERIGKYCMKDVLTTAKVFLRLKGITDIMPEPVFVND